MKSCGCGCGELIPDKTKHGDPATFKFGHQNRGKNNPMYGRVVIQTAEARKKISDSKLGEKAYNWKGDNAGYFAIHRWLRVNMPKPELCECCKNKPPQHIANVTGVYTRDFSNWKYMCARCHFYFDKRWRGLKQWWERGNNNAIN
jgi:hypothetical protein